jgi:hypothetical protein
MSAKRPLIIIGTSGSHDYLKPNENDNKRFWPVRVVVASAPDRLEPSAAAALKDYLLRTPDEARSYQRAVNAPSAHGDRADLPTAEPDESGKARPDDPTKMEY